MANNDAKNKFSRVSLPLLKINIKIKNKPLIVAIKKMVEKKLVIDKTLGINILFTKRSKLIKKDRLFSDDI
jgi:hypothetical protein